MKFLRGGVVWVGLGVLGVLGMIELVLRRRSRTESALVEPLDDPRAGTASGEPPVSRAVARSRTVLGVLGVALALYGGYLVVRTIPWTSYLAIAIWLAAAVLLHDGVLVPAVSVLRAATVRAGRRLTAGSLAVLEGAFVVAGVVSLIAVPEIWAKHLGPLNATVLPGAYGRALLVTWLVVASLAAASVGILAVLARRRTAHPLQPAR